MSRKHTKGRRVLVKLTLLLGVGCLLYLLFVTPFQRYQIVSRQSLNAEVATEITVIGQSLQVFKVDYGLYPPSDLTVREDGGLWEPSSKTAVRRLWPHFDFQTPFDLNNDGDTDDVHALNGAECLVFFLGGLSVGDRQLIGFSKNPVVPFHVDSISRHGPFFDFDRERLIDVDDDGFFEYADKLNCHADLPAPFLYIVRQPSGHFGRTGLTVFPSDSSRNMQQPYDIVDTSMDYQIISPGVDGEYGLGGIYHPDGMNFSGDRKVEADNVTSFSASTLE